MGKLEGKVALITGAGQGIGQGIALALAKEGAVIAVAGRTESKLHTTCGLLADIGARGEAVVCDVSKKDDITDAVDRTVELFGGIDILVNNANDCKPGPLLSVLDEDFERSFATGPLATLRMMQASYPHMNSRGGGVIINMVTSAAVRWDASNYGAYGSIKEGMRSLTPRCRLRMGQGQHSRSQCCPARQDSRVAVVDGKESRRGGGICRRYSAGTRRRPRDRHRSCRRLPRQRRRRLPHGCHDPARRRPVALGLTAIDPIRSSRRRRRRQSSAR